MNTFLAAFNCSPHCCAPCASLDAEQVARPEGKAASFMIANEPWEKETFEVNFGKADTVTMGIEFSIVEGELVVLGAKPDTLAWKYNAATRDEHLQILPGDRVVAVNGDKGRGGTSKAAEFLTAMNDAPNKGPPGNVIVLTLQHAVLSHLDVVKGGKKLGLIVNHGRRNWARYLEVERVNEGVIMEYNRTCCGRDRGLGPGDKIVKVNGVKGSPQVLLEKLGDKSATTLNISFVPAPGLM